MFVSDDLVFLHLQKAAGTFVVDRLAQRLPGTVTGGHAPLVQGPQGRVVAAAIRDPWDWYVSLWSYGCMGEGAVQGWLTAPHGHIRKRILRGVLTGRIRPGDALTRLRLDHGRDPGFWRDLYTSANDGARFRRWLRGILEMPTCSHLPDHYPHLPMCGEVGYMTFRVLRLFTDWSAWQAGAHEIRTPAEAVAFYHCHCIVDHVLRTERVEADLDRLLAALSLTTASLGESAERPAKNNRSKRRRHAAYYDAETAALVAEKDRMVIETFGYAPPDLAG